MSTLKRRFTSRKFIGSAIVFITSLVLLATGTITEGTWSTMVLTVYATYSGSNVLEKGISQFSGSSLASSGQKAVSEGQA